jgi:hypothetical protein
MVVQNALIKLAISGDTILFAICTRYSITWIQTPEVKIIIQLFYQLHQTPWQRGHTGKHIIWITLESHEWENGFLNVSC